MVTMLAIEQLTGTAKPTIVTLGSTSGTGATKALLELQNQLNAARTQENSAAESVKAETAKVTPKQKAYDTAKKEHDDKKTANPADPTLPALQKVYQDKKVELDSANAELTKAKTKYSDTQKNRSTIEASLKAARDNIDTGAENGTSQIGGAQGNYYVGTDSGATQHIASVVRDIQQTHLWQSYATGDCLRFLLQDTNMEMKKWEGVHKIKIREMCVQQIQKSTKWRFEKLYLSYGCTIDGKNCKYDPNKKEPAPPAAPSVVPNVGAPLIRSNFPAGAPSISRSKMIPGNIIQTNPTSPPDSANSSPTDTYVIGPAALPPPTRFIPETIFSK
jgi:hypothetical protein